MATKLKQQSFQSRCYSALKKVPAGRVTTYKLLAKHLGSSAYRAVGTAMARNPFAPKVPCHRVVKSDGTLGGYSGGLKKKVALLEKEGVAIEHGCVTNFKSKLYKF